MWTLLIRSEVRPESAGIRSIPVEHVLRDAFKREKDSDLWITNAGMQIGTLRLSPKQDEVTGTRTLGFIGRVTLNLPDGSSQRPGWSGSLVMNRNWVVQSFHLSSTTRGFPAGLGAAPTQATQLEVLIDPPAHKGWYVVRVENEVADQHEFTLDEEGISQLVAHLGIDQDILKQLPGSKSQPPEVTARQSSFMVRSEKLETYLVTISMKGQTLLEAQVSQLGEVLHVQTLIGWTMDQAQ
jgi:hypothetical protein